MQKRYEKRKCNLTESEFSQEIKMRKQKGKIERQDRKRRLKEKTERQDRKRKQKEKIEREEDVDYEDEISSG